MVSPKQGSFPGIVTSNSSHLWSPLGKDTEQVGLVGSAQGRGGRPSTTSTPLSPLYLVLPVPGGFAAFHNVWPHRNKLPRG